jgi:hypothetical protein
VHASTHRCRDGTSLAAVADAAARIGIVRWFMSNYENLGYRWDLRMQPATIVVVLAIFGAPLLAQWSTGRGLKRINVATIVGERSL